MKVELATVLWLFHLKLYAKQVSYLGLDSFLKGNTWKALVK